MALSSIEDALIALREGKPVLVADDESRENEVDAIMAAQYANTKWIAWMIRYTSGYLCAPMTEQRANHLDLNLMATTNQDPYKTQYTITVDAAEGTSTGISAADRALTFRVLADADSTKDSLIRPGHVIPLRAHQNGVLDRRGHTEATVDLLKLAGLAPVGVIGEMVNDDGEMTRLDDAYAAEPVANSLRSELGPDWSLLTWGDQYATFFGLINQQRVMMYFALSFIVLVSAFSMMADRRWASVNSSRAMLCSAAISVYGIRSVNALVTPGSLGSLSRRAR